MAANDTFTSPADWGFEEAPTSAKLNEQLRDNIYALWLAITTGSASITERFSSGTYTPTLTNNANIAASTAYQCQWLRIDNTVTVSGKVDIDPTSASVQTILRMTLPVASNIGALEDLAGVGVLLPGAAADQVGVAIKGSISTDEAEFEFFPPSAANRAWYFTFTYQVI